MTHLHTISAEKLQGKRHLHIVDIRDPEERQSELGFIPGSLFAPDQSSLDELLMIIPEHDSIVLTCLSGKRSEAMARTLFEAHAADERSVYNLEGGVLGWSSANLPLATYEPDDPASFVEDSEADFLIKMRSCFVGEVVEVIVERDLDLNPLELLQMSTHLANMYFNGMPLEERVIDFAGYVSWQIGTHLGHIAANMTWALQNRHLLRAQMAQDAISWSE